MVDSVIGLRQGHATPSTIILRVASTIASGGGGGTFPAVADVDFGVIYGPTDNLTGTLVQPIENDVRNGVNYGGDGVEFNGDLVLPVAADVEAGVGYGADGTELIGTVTLPAEADVKLGTTYGAGGTEFTGTLSGGGNTITYRPRRSRN